MGVVVAHAGEGVEWSRGVFCFFCYLPGRAGFQSTREYIVAKVFLLSDVRVV